MVVGARAPIDFMHLRLDFLPLPMFPHVGRIDFIVEMADIADHGSRFERLQHGGVTDVIIAGGRYDQVRVTQQRCVDVFHLPRIVSTIVGRHDLKAVHTGLHRANGVDFRHAHDHAFLAQGLGRSFPHVSISDHQGFLPRQKWSVPRFTASFKLCRHPYLLSFFDFVTESLTLMTGTFRSRCPAAPADGARPWWSLP